MKTKTVKPNEVFEILDEERGDEKWEPTGFFELKTGTMPYSIEGDCVKIPMSVFYEHARVYIQFIEDHQRPDEESKQKAIDEKLKLVGGSHPW